MRPEYHLTAPFGLINDPNGFIKYQGEYYIFFQWNPTSLKHENKHWGLKKTKDFVHFTEAEIDLKPDQYFDKDGCYSGSSRIINNQLYLIYTGNVKNGNKRESYQCLALKDSKEYKKLGPILSNIPEGYTDHFRDPFYFKRENEHYFMIGAQNKNKEGKALIYKWQDLEHPELFGEINLEFDFKAYMWECPNILNIDGKDIFIFSPQGIEKEDYRYQNIYNSVYSIGKLNMESLDFNNDYYEELDYGFDFYAPQVLEEEQLLIAWMGLPEDEDLQLSKEENWMHSLTMVRQLSIVDDKLIQKPHESYLSLRDTSYKLSREDFVESKFGEINIELNINENSQFSLDLFKSENYLINLSYKNNCISLNREKSQSLSGLRNLKLDQSNNLKLQIFMDKSTLEVFINDGRHVMSSRVYNTDKIVGFEISEMINCELVKYDYHSYEVTK